MSSLSPTSWAFWALLSALFAALTALFAKVGVREIDSDVAMVVRTGIVFVLFFGLVWYLGKLRGTADIPPRTWLFLTLSALATGASLLCYFRALQLGPVSVVAPVDKLSVPLAVLLAVTFLGERPTLREWLAIALITTGVLVLVTRKVPV